MEEDICKNQILFQGVPSKADHDNLEGHSKDGFVLANTGGTGNYEKATGTMFIANVLNVQSNDGKGPVLVFPPSDPPKPNGRAPAQPSRVGTVEVCGI